MGANGVCVLWSSKWCASGTMSCQSATGICTKAIVTHVHNTPRSMGVLMQKRSKCDKKTGRCFVYKAGLCIDIKHAGKLKDGTNAKSYWWSNKWNDHLADQGESVPKQAQRWARAVELLLEEHNEKLPEKYH